MNHCARKTFGGCWLVVALVLALNGQSAQASEGLLTAAAALQAGDFTQARDLYAAEAQADRLCAVARVGVGAAELFLGHTSEAARAFADAQMLDPNLGCARLGAGTALSLTGNWREAEAQYHAALPCALRPALALAAEAYATCALGLYDTALQNAQAALDREPDQGVARYAFAAASLARGDSLPAAQLLNKDGYTAARRSRAPLDLPSCLLSPGVAYWKRHRVADEQRVPLVEPQPAPPSVAPTPVVLTPTPPVAAPAPAPAVPAPVATPAPPADFRLASPHDGQTVSGVTTVEVATGPEVQLEYVTVLVNDAFAGVTAVKPYRITLDTRQFAAGPAEIRVDGCGPAGRVLRTATLRVSIRNGNRTLAPVEVALRTATAQTLEEVLLPPISPVVFKQLAGHGLMGLGQAESAAAAFESAYACNGDVPGLRSDLLVAYRALGLEPRAVAPEIHTLRGRDRQVALTFDDGPHPLITPWILDLLDKEHIKATFLLVGKQVTLYPELAREIRRRGHQIGCHSYAHYSLRNLSSLECEQDLVKCRLAIREACGETVSLFRPPGGYYDATVRAAAGALGMSTVFWTCNITSFPGRDGKNIAAELARQCQSGGIVLLHNGEDETLDTLPHLIPELRKRGVTFTTITPELAHPSAVASSAEGSLR